jgi:8-oxo-dGTP pyrophosphatase MutT (NUDIX family)
MSLSSHFPEPWTVESSRVTIDTPWFTVREDVCLLPTGKKLGTYYVCESPPFVHVAAFDAENRLLLVWQYRHGVGQIVPELPGGCMDADESDPCVAATRELREETGFTAGHCEPLLKVSPNPARQNNMAHFFLATDLTDTGQVDWDETEHIYSRFCGAEEVAAMIREGTFLQGYHLPAVMLAFERRGVRLLSLI